MNMLRNTLLPICILTGLLAHAQFPPPAGQAGTTAIAADSSVFVAWATACTVTRGPMDISDTGAGLASVGDESMATGPGGSNGVVSLGDGGVAILTFAEPIVNGIGWDFAVFENSFSDTFLELAFVEVSSNGVDYHRFPATSNTQTATQVGGFGTVDATLIDNLAGKYRAGFGTPFDLDQLAGAPGLDVNAITHVTIIDAVGCIQDAFTTYDHLGQKVNDPWSTPFPSSGFDLDAVGVINSISTSIVPHARAFASFALYPNPANERSSVYYTMENAEQVTIEILDAAGRTVWSITPAMRTRGDHRIALDLAGLKAGLYLVQLSSPGVRTTQRLIIDHAL
jgi:hypothetical protein